MTFGDFILGILGSLIASLLLKSSKLWRYGYDKSLYGLSLLMSLTAKKLTLRHLRLTASAFVMIVTTLVFLYQSPKLATDEIITKKVPTRNSQPIITNHIVMRPCVPEVYSACSKPVNRRNRVQPASSSAEPQFIAGIVTPR
jgi:hypothetical protein